MKTHHSLALNELLHFHHPLSVSRLTLLPSVKSKFSKCDGNFSFLPPINSSFKVFLPFTLPSQPCIHNIPQIFIALKQIDCNFLLALIPCPPPARYPWTMSFKYASSSFYVPIQKFHLLFTLFTALGWGWEGLVFTINWKILSKRCLSLEILTSRLFSACPPCPHCLTWTQEKNNNHW